MLFSTSSIIDREWHNALQEFSGYDNTIEYYILAEEGDGGGYDDSQVSLSLAEVVKVRHAFRELSDITGASFVETNDFESAILNVYSVSEYEEEDTDGETVMEDEWFDITWRNYGGSSMTDYETLTIYHEIGHAAGLDHPNGNGDEPGWDDSITVMSYNEGDFIPTTFRELDIEALQVLFATTPEPTPAPVPTPEPYDGIIKSVRGKGKLKGTDVADAFTFDSLEVFTKKGADKIIGFNSSEGDSIAISPEAFPALQGSSEINFASTNKKKMLKLLSKQDYDFIYFEKKGRLYFDGNGAGNNWGNKDEGGLVAVLKGKPELTLDDFTMLA